MTQRSQSPDGRPSRRSDATRPPRTRRGGDRPPYPGARTPRPHATSRPGTRSTPRRTTASPIPPTVWTCGADAIDSRQPWPVPIVEALTTSFSAPRSRVLLGPNADEAAMDAVRALNRDVEALADLEPDSTGGQSRPFWTDLVTGNATPTADPPTPEPTAVEPGDRVELILVSLPADAAAAVSLDRLALMAAARLRFGGVLAVYTHSDWNQGHLTDPTGAVIAAAQNADLLYLQHIVTLHTPVRDGQLRAAPTPAAAADYEAARHRATVRGMPAPHLRAHGDVLVFAQPGNPAGDHA